MESDGDTDALPASASSKTTDDHDAASQPELLPFQYITVAAGAAIVLPLLYRLGPASSLLIIVFAVGISAVPELRQVVDSVLGKTAAGRDRLASQQVTPTISGRQTIDANNVLARNPIDAEAYIPLDVGDALQPPLSRLIDLVQRDFIDYWYTSSVALSSDTPFPQHTRSLLNATFNNLVARVKRQDPKEVSIYLFHSASNALITQVRENKEGQALDSGLALQEKQNLIRKVRRTSEELMLTLAPRSACASPLVLSLLTEVLSLQIWSTIQSLNSDFINTTIVSSFGQAVTAVKEVQKDAQEAEAKQQKLDKTAGATGSQDSQSVLEHKQENGQTLAIDPVTQVQRTKPMSGLDAVEPPPLPMRKVPSSSGTAVASPEVPRKPPQSISFDSPDHTFAASGIPSYGMMGATTAAYVPRQRTGDSSNPSSSRPNSVPNSPRSISARLEDRSLEDALDHGAARLKAFGKGLFSAGQKFLDAAIPPDEGTAIYHARQQSSDGAGGGTNSRRGSVQLPGSPRAPSLKGKERAIDQDDIGDGPGNAGSAGNSSPTMSMRSPSMARDPSRKSTTSLGSGFGSLISPPSSRPNSIIGSGTASSAASTANLSAHDKLQIAIDILKSKDADRCAHLAKQLERSLFSKDLALLFPAAPQDDQLRAILARHTSSEEMVDPTLIDLDDDFHSYLERDSSGTGERLLRLWTQLDHFGYMVEITKPTPDQLYDDALGLLQKTTNQMDDIPFSSDEAGAKDEKAYITACEMTMLRLQQNPNREIFEPLQDWLIQYIQEKYWNAFVKEKAGKDGLQRPATLERVPSASTSRRTLDSISDASSRHLVDDGDLGMSMREDDDDAQPRASQALPTSASATGIASAAGMQLPPQLTPSSEAAEEAQIPAFSVTLTDLSPPSAYLNNHVKNRKELEFLIAVEVEGSPGYILARKYLEFEKMDTGIKKALPQSGTKAFPRAPLPSTNFQTSDNLCRSLEHYLEALLHDDRYASSEPVMLFFAKERTDSKGGPVQPLAFLGRGVNNLGKGVADVTKGIGKGGELAGKSLATGFTQFTSAVTTLPGLKRTTSSGPAETVSPTRKPGSKRFSISSTSLVEDEDAVPTSESTDSLKSPSMTSLSVSIPEKDESVDEGAPTTSRGGKEGAKPTAPPALPPRPRSPEGYEVPDPTSEQSTTSNLTQTKEANQVPPLPAKEEASPPPAPPAGFSYTPRRKATKSMPSSPTSQPIALPVESVPVIPPPQPASPTLRGRMSFDELLKQDQEAARKQSEEVDGLKPVPTEAGSRATSPLPLPSMLSPVEFNNVLSFAMAILEEAYDLADSTWNIKRGLLKVLETVLRTSYAGVIKAAVQKLVMMASDETSYGKRIDGLTDSFWPLPERIWWSSLPGAKDKPDRTAAEKEETRLEARRLLLLQAPEGLKVTLGSAATADAFGKLHDALQGQGAERLVSSLVLDYLRLLLL